MTDAFDARDLTPDLVRRLLAAQFPQYASLPIRPAFPQGWDNRTFRLGSDLLVRLPSAAGYVPQVAKEHRWLPVLAAALPWPVPAPVALGQPGEGYPFPWSVYRWLDGESAGSIPVPNLVAFAGDVARFLRDLQGVDAVGGPPAGAHSSFRGAPLATYDADTRGCLADLGDVVDVAAAARVWDAALSEVWTGRPVWVHGDMAVNNLLVRDGRLSAVIDFGCAAVGDPACDLVLAWTLFEGESRNMFRSALMPDEGLWARARGWALWKALLQLREAGPAADAARRVVEAVIEDQRRGEVRPATSIP